MLLLAWFVWWPARMITAAYFYGTGNCSFETEWTFTRYLCERFGSFGIDILLPLTHAVAVVIVFFIGAFLQGDNFHYALTQSRAAVNRKIKLDVGIGIKTYKHFNIDRFFAIYMLMLASFDSLGDIAVLIGNTPVANLTSVLLLPTAVIATTLFFLSILNFSAGKRAAEVPKGCLAC